MYWQEYRALDTIEPFVSRGPIIRVLLEKTVSVETQCLSVQKGTRFYIRNTAIVRKRVFLVDRRVVLNLALQCNVMSCNVIYVSVQEQQSLNGVFCLTPRCY